MARDARADGQFVYAVRTTGIYCRPGCGSRLPRPANVEFHSNPADAQRAGFRPCLRCRPDGPSLAAQQLARVEAACRSIEQAARAPALAMLAREAGLSPYHFHRLFKSTTGVTPHAYAAALRTRRLQERLQDASRTSSITEALYDSGYLSGASAHADARTTLGMTPSRFRAGGASLSIDYALDRCSLGAILVAQSEQGLCAILLGDDATALLADLRRRFPAACLQAGDAAFAATVAAVIRFVDAPRLGLKLPLDLRGTAFQRRVWEALRHVPAGATATYSEIARRIGLPRATRAVAAACAANPLAVAIPCHRVLRADGSLSGYRWGLERKSALLAREHTGPTASDPDSAVRETHAADCRSTRCGSSDSTDPLK